MNFFRDILQSVVLGAVPLFKMPNGGIPALYSAARSTYEDLDVVTIANARVVDYLHRCAWNVFLVESQAAKFISGKQQIVQSVCSCQVVRLHIYKLASI